MIDNDNVITVRSAMHLRVQLIAVLFTYSVPKHCFLVILLVDINPETKRTFLCTAETLLNYLSTPLLTKNFTFQHYTSIFES